jgi:hypothetical protein
VRSTKNRNIILFVVIFSSNVILADNRIICYLKKPSVIDINAVKKKASLSGLKYDEGNDNVKKVFSPSLGGFKVLYGGYRHVTRKNGLISFPLRHISQYMYVAVTPKINIVKVKDSTVSRIEYVKGIPKKVYKFEKKADSKKLDYWNVVDLGDVKGVEISPLTMVVLTYPNNIVIKTGHIMATKNPQVVLPDIVVAGDFEKEKTNIENIAVNKFFEEVVIEKNKASDKVVRKKVKNS